jgi:hypothetical protein
MAKGKLHGTTYKAGNQDLENSNMLASGRTLLKRKIESIEHDKNGPYSPSTPKRQTRSSKETNTNFLCLMKSANQKSVPIHPINTVALEKESSSAASLEMEVKTIGNADT